MQKFVIKKITRSTNITIEDQNFLDAQVLNDDENLEAASVRMCGYLKKKRNFAGWQKLYFVLQNGLLMSYNTKEEYERKLVSFKDIICLIPGSTILLPSLEPRFTIASNLNTFYTFRCDNQQVCSKWITAILECLARDIKSEFIGKKSITKSFRSQQNLNTQRSSNVSCQHSRQPNNHSWENLFPGSNSNWLVNHNGRILLELNYMNCNRAKLPIANQTAKILKNVGNSDVIRTTKKINFITNDENQNALLKNGCKVEDESEAHATHQTPQHNPKKPDQFRLHNEVNGTEKKSRIVNRISKIFPSSSSTSPSSSTSTVVALPESESQTNNDKFLMQSNGFENGIEEQQLELSFGPEYSLFSLTGDYASVDSTRFNNKLNIENIYSEINPNSIYAVPKKSSGNKWIKSNLKDETPQYSVIDLSKKYEERSKKKQQELNLNLIAESEGEEKLNIMVKNLNIYEDVEIAKAKNSNNNVAIKNDETNIYEMIDIPLRPSRKARSLVWKNWSRMHIFNLFKESPPESSKSLSSRSSTCSSDATIKKRAKHSLTLTNFSFTRHYRSMRNKARKICRKSQSTPTINNLDPLPSTIT